MVYPQTAMGAEFVSGRRYETLSPADTPHFYNHVTAGELFSVFLDVLHEYRGVFLQEVGHMVSQNVQEVLYGKNLSLKYSFENADTISLLLEPMDSRRLVCLCNPNSAPKPVTAP